MTQIVSFNPTSYAGAFTPAYQEVYHRARTDPQGTLTKSQRVISSDHSSPADVVYSIAALIIAGASREMINAAIEIASAKRGEFDFSAGGCLVQKLALANVAELFRNAAQADFRNPGRRPDASGGAGGGGGAAAGGGAGGVQQAGSCFPAHERFPRNNQQQQHQQQQQRGARPNPPCYFQQPVCRERGAGGATHPLVVDLVHAPTSCSVCGTPLPHCVVAWLCPLGHNFHACHQCCIAQFAPGVLGKK